MNKKLVKLIIPLCIFILFAVILLQKANNRYNKTEVIEAMVNNEEENDKIDINLKLTIAKLVGIFKIYIKVKMNGIMN